MQSQQTTDMLIVRHAPSLADGRLCGSRDVAADCSDAAALGQLRPLLADATCHLSSPARRCVETAAALWPGTGVGLAPAALTEQHFGAWEGLALADLPDLGPLDAEALARHRAPGGESFADLCARAGPALRTLAADHPGGRVCLVAHAGTVRAALSLALGSPAPALAFEVAPLSLSRFRVLSDGTWTVVGVNWRPV